ncbi:MAG: hypothetical protein HN341_07635 [Verrucomicrobia bacterium]|nr:hypothetical protein [Verrucomicrobiota bacterium]
MTHSELQALFSRLSGMHIGVIGDFALDCYWTVNTEASLPAVETGKPTQPVSDQRYAAGAAGNVVADLVALGCGTISAFGVVGDDPWGAELKRILEGLGADTTGMLQQEGGWATVAYAKPHVNGVEQCRLDFGDFNHLDDAVADSLIDRLAVALPGLDALVINSQAASGIHSERLRQRLEALIIENPSRIFVVDSRESELMYAGCTLKINDFEAVRCGDESAASAESVSRDQAWGAAEKLYVERGLPVFVTRGSEGMVVFDDGEGRDVPAVRLTGEVDTVGAGDAALAGITAALASGSAPVDAARCGTLCAAVCSAKLRQTGTASPEEILALVGQHPTLFGGA